MLTIYALLVLQSAATDTNARFMAPPIRAGKVDLSIESQDLTVEERLRLTLRPARNGYLVVIEQEESNGNWRFRIPLTPERQVQVTAHQEYFLTDETGAQAPTVGGGSGWRALYAFTTPGPITTQILPSKRGREGDGIAVAQKNALAPALSPLLAEILAGRTPNARYYVGAPADLRAYKQAPRIARPLIESDPRWGAPPTLPTLRRPTISTPDSARSPSPTSLPPSTELPTATHAPLPENSFTPTAKGRLVDSLRRAEALRPESLWPEPFWSAEGDPQGPGLAALREAIDRARLALQKSLFAPDSVPPQREGVAPSSDQAAKAFREALRALLRAQISDALGRLRETEEPHSPAEGPANPRDS